MPYIPQERRILFENAITDIVEKLGSNYEETHDNTAKGDLNYVIFSIVKRYIDKHGIRYHRLQDFIDGALGHCQRELYRRLSAPYEDAAIKKNGDV